VKRVPAGSASFLNHPRIGSIVKRVLTCPKCAYLNVRKVGKVWKCGTCGTSFDLRKLRKNLELLVGSVFADDFIEQLLRGAKLKRYLKLGERGWKWVGKYAELHTIDEGNGWYRVVRVIVKGRKGKSRQG